MQESFPIIGREKERQVLSEFRESCKPEFLAIYGRYHVGKTFLVRSFFHNDFDFSFSGSFETPRATQLRLFKGELERYSGKKRKKPADWFEAFEQLRDYLSSLKKDRIVVFLDELPWMDTPRSSFLQAISYFWNSWASTQPQIKLVVCGSATTWMFSKLIGDRGGMHGRVNRQMYLRPFNLAETEAFLRQKGIIWNRYQITEVYMAMGGIPYYLDMLEPSLPFNENIDRLFFADGAPLRTEYNYVFRSLFKNSSLYRTIVETLSKKSTGMTQAAIAEAVHVDQNGALSEALSNLCTCDFLRTYKAFGKKQKEQLYQLADLYSLFYLKFVEPTDSQDEQFWSNMQDTGERRSWEGYAFEQVCLHHIPQIKDALRIGGVLSEVCSWQCRPFEDSDGNQHKGTQIDLLIDRRDEVIDVCEMKFSAHEYAITADYDQRLRERLATFRALTGTKKALHFVLVTTYGLSRNAYSGNVQQVVTLDDLFRS